MTAPRWDCEAERQFWRHQCRNSFWEFVRFAFGAGGWGGKHPWLDESLHRPICDWYEGHIREWLTWRAAGEKRVKFLSLLVSRDVGKSALITKAGQLWLHLQDPELSSYTGSEKTEFAVDFLQSIKAVIDGSDPGAMFTTLYGNWYDPRRTWKTENVVHAMRLSATRTEPSFGTWGVESGITGKHPDALFLDDPISYEKMALHSNWLRTVNSHMDSLIPVLKKDGLICLVGTRYHDGDHFGRCFRIDGVKSITGMKPPDVQVKPEGLWDLYFLAARDEAGHPAMPNIWTETALRRYEANDPLKYAAQLLNDPANSEFNPLTLTQVRECIVDDKDVPWKMLHYTLHMDTAFKTLERQASGDETVLQVWGHEPRTGLVWFIEGFGSNVWRAEECAEKVAMLCQKYKKAGRRLAMLTDEQGMGGKDGAWELALQSYCHNLGVGLPPFTTLQRGKKKLQRIVEAAAFWCDGKVKLPKNAPGVERLIEQMSRIGSSAHDDWADTAADVFHPKCYQVLHKRGETDEDGVELQGRRPWDEYLRDGGGGHELMQAEMYGGRYGPGPVGND